MKFTAAFVTAALALAAAPALATPVADPELDKRANTVRVCTGANWDGQCVTFTPDYNRCYPFAALGLSGYQSFGPSQGTVCLWYDGDNCGGGQSDLVGYPGWAPVPGYWSFNTRSWKCWW